jgi:hypothetical protein
MLYEAREKEQRDIRAREKGAIKDTTIGLLIVAMMGKSDKHTTKNKPPIGRYWLIF